MAQVNWNVVITRHTGRGDVLVTNEMLELLQAGWHIVGIDEGKIFWSKAEYTLSRAQRHEKWMEEHGRTSESE